MLPTGHIAAGYLTGLALLKFANPNISPHQSQHLLLWATFFGFLPDVDMFFAFFKQKTMLVSANDSVSHRKFFSHAPILWFILGILIYFFITSTYFKFVGLALWLGSWSHFLLDSIEGGIMWLWPLNSKVYALKSLNVKFVISERNFFRHNWQFLKRYSKTLSFYLEIIIIISALIVFFK